jgi:hypothetical protein
MKTVEIKKPTETEVFIWRLKALLDLYKAHPELTPPCLYQFDAFPEDKDKLFAIGRALSKKVHLGDSYAQVRLDIDDGLKLIFSVNRSAVCERVQVGTRVVEKDVVITTGTETVVEPIYKWVCPPDLGVSEEA